MLYTRLTAVTVPLVKLRLAWNSGPPEYYPIDFRGIIPWMELYELSIPGVQPTMQGQNGFEKIFRT